MPNPRARRLLLLLSLWGPLVRRAQTGSEGQTATELYQRWERYRRECQESLVAARAPLGLACNGSFDMYICWDYTAPNATARASCPWYLPWYHDVAAGFVLRQCGSDGQWGPWRDHSQCENPEKNGAFQDQRLILERLQVVYTVGYSVSLATLLLALFLLSCFRRLRCTRNYIHINLFTSFVLRAAAILTRDRLLPPPGPYSADRAPTLWNQALAACRTAQVVTQYCVGANYTWLLVEGVYLHSLLVLVGGSEGGHFRCYLLLGWGAPALFVIPWVIVRYLYENTQCWERNEVKAIWWIIRTPILMTILVNFLIFLRILGILVSKLRTRQMRCPDYRLRLARSTLTLVPLLGVHEVVFAPVTEEQARGTLRFAKLGFEIFLSSFQVLGAGSWVLSPEGPGLTSSRGPATGGGGKMAFGSFIHSSPSPKLAQAWAEGSSGDRGGRLVAPAVLSPRDEQRLRGQTDLDPLGYGSFPAARFREMPSPRGQD
ncbi:gastric inhibitory polypeptide receptor isoform X1 [Dasypus novemcinctus]|uniref:gastric inhibitory polypeptide receptor isoform X1 n=1 Tax=Dasypus novemcinctus TaxID=9361 RepID=UPI0039C8F5C2